MAKRVPVVPKPCGWCPWRLDSPVGLLPEVLDITGTPEQDKPIGTPMMGCHMADYRAMCAGWLAVTGVHHVGVRLAVATRQIDPKALSPGEDWPELHESLDAAIQAGKLAHHEGGEQVGTTDAPYLTD